MENSNYLKLIKAGVTEWNTWRNNAQVLNPDLRNTDLSGLDIHGIDLRGADLSGSNLSNATLRKAILLDTKFEKANLDNALMSSANLINANFFKASVNRTNFVDSNLTRASFVEARAYGAIFDGATLTNGVFFRANLGEATFRGAYCSSADFRNSYLQQANFHEADLTNADFSEADLHSAILDGTFLIDTKLISTNLIYSDLRFADMRRSILSKAFLFGSNLSSADLRGADLDTANLQSAICINTNMEGANLSGCLVHGISAWGIKMKGAKQSNLIITQDDEPIITVDNLEVAQFIYLLLFNDKIRSVIDTVTAKVVLILGRFTPARKVVLEAIRNELRHRDFIPVLFDFEKPTNRDLTETISTLAHLSRFVIADITDARSVPQELTAIISNLPSVPVQPIIQYENIPYAMFEHFSRYPWVLKTLEYKSPQDIIGGNFDKIVLDTEAKTMELAGRQPIKSNKEVDSAEEEETDFFQVSMSRFETFVTKVNVLPSKPVAFEAYWDGDSSGWYVVLVVITENPSYRHSKFEEHDLSVFQGEGGDFRLFKGGFGPRKKAGPRQWPEALEAKAYGDLLGKKFGLSFYFPSPIKPDDNLPRWWDTINTTDK